MNFDNFLKESEIIDFLNPNIQKLSVELVKDFRSDIEIAKNCFFM